MQYEGEIKGFKNFLAGHKATVEQTKKEKAGYSEESWTKLKEVCSLATMYMYHRIPSRINLSCLHQKY